MPDGTTLATCGSTMQRILVADDDDGLRDALGELLARLGYQVLHAADGHDALRVVQERAPLLSILDFHMPGMTGLEILHQLRPTRSGPLPCILVSAEATASEREEAIAVGAYGFFSKPFDIELLLACVEEVRRTFGPLTLGNLDLARLLGPPRSDVSELPVPLDLLFRTRLRLESRKGKGDEPRPQN